MGKFIGEIESDASERVLFPRRLEDVDRAVAIVVKRVRDRNVGQERGEVVTRADFVRMHFFEPAL